VIDDNTLISQSETGITLSNAAGSRANLQITNNHISDPQFNGIATQDYNWPNATISANTISRQVGFWPDDNIHTQFLALSLYPAGSPVTVSNNTILETGTIILGFRFVGVSVNGTQNANRGTVYDSNTISSNLLQPTGIGFFVNNFGGMDDAIVTNNTFQNLALVTSGQASPGVIFQNNVAINCLQVGVVSLVQ
jgi:hypothetical protein